MDEMLAKRVGALLERVVGSCSQRGGSVIPFEFDPV